MRWHRAEGYAPSSSDQELAQQASKRVARLTTTALLDWADAAGSGMAKGFDDYRKHGDLASVEEIALGMITLQAVVYELKLRAEAES